MMKLMILAVLASALIGLAAAAQATHTDWTKDFWEQQDRQSGGA